jgi:glycerol transport system ATP-binding protein
MARLVLDHIAHSYRQEKPGAPLLPKDFALKEVHQTLADGGAYALLGPSGCGKTTLLNILSGLIIPSHGRVLFNAQDVTFLAPEARNIAQVFQFPVIYDTMTVFENLAFPLRNRKIGEEKIRLKVHQTLEMLGLSAKANRKAQLLGADEKQKISLGRGLVRDDVHAILFDEPLTVIDPHMKWQLRSQLKQLHQRYGFTMVYVTHDQTEALTFADKVVVMHEGEVVQVGTPQELFARPRHSFVGYFIGSPGMNFLPCNVQANKAFIAGHALSLAADYPALSGRVELGIRPEFLQLSQRPEALAVRVRAVEDIGRHKILRARLEGYELAVLLAEGTEIPAEPKLFFDPQHINIYHEAHLVEP